MRIFDSIFKFRMEEIQEKNITREIFKELKPHFRNKLGKYTHQRISGDWHFHGLVGIQYFLFNAKPAWHCFGTVHLLSTTSTI